MDAQNRHIQAKFDLAAKLAAHAKSRDATALTLKLASIRSRYALSTGYLFLRAILGGSSLIAAREEFAQVVSTENFVGDLDKIVDRVQMLLKITPRQITKGSRVPIKSQRSCTPKQREIRRLAAQYWDYRVDCALNVVEKSAKTQQYNVCPNCNYDMGVIPDTSELACSRCGRVRELIGTVFDDSQFYNQEGQKAKSGSFNPNRHFRYWMDHILAREPEEELGDKDDERNQYGEKLLDRLRELVKRDNRILRMLTITDVRDMLKDIGRTDLNKNAALILKKLTGVGPPHVPESLYQRVEKLFSKSIEISEHIRFKKRKQSTEEAPRTRANRNHYPYYIYKILDADLAETDSENRRILYYIYMQGEDTVSDNDEEWKEICAKLNQIGIKIQWVSTDRTKANKYRSD